MPGSQDAVYVDQVGIKHTFNWGARQTYEGVLNYRGVLGTARFVDELRPRPVHLLDNVSPFTKIATSGSSAVWISANQLCWCTGRNTHGERGIGSSTDSQTAHPLSVVALAVAVVDVSAGGDDGIFGFSGGTMFAVRSSGEAYSWGHNADGQMGMGDTTQRTSVTLVWDPIARGAGIVRVHAGWRHAALLDDQGRVWTAGNNADGQLGRGTLGVNSTSWGQVAAPGGGLIYTDIACSNNCTLLLVSDGTVRAAGDGTEHQLGPTIFALAGSHTATPTVVDSLTDIVELQSVGESSWFRNSAGAMFVYGRANPGLVGTTGTDFFTSAAAAPRQVNIDWVNAAAGFPYTPSSPITITIAKLAYVSGNVPKISLGQRNGYGVLGSDGKVYTWTRNIEGQLGDGTTTGAAAAEVFLSMNDLSGAETSRAFTWGAYQVYVGGASCTLNRYHFSPTPSSDTRLLRQLSGGPADPTNWQTVGFDDSAWTAPVAVTPDPTHPVVNSDNHGTPVWERNPEPGTNLNVLARQQVLIPAETDAFDVPGVLATQGPFGPDGPRSYVEFPPGRNMELSSLWVNGTISTDTVSPFWATMIVPNTVNLFAWRQPDTRNLGAGTGGDTTVWMDWDRVVVYISAIALVEPAVLRRSWVAVIG